MLPTAGGRTISIMVAGSAPETLNAHGGTVRRGSPSGYVVLVPVKCEPSGGESRVRLGAGLGNEAMQPSVSQVVTGLTPRGD